MMKVRSLMTWIISLLLIVSCATIKPVPVETIINYKDSTIVNVIDSTVYIPKERIVDIVPAYDTLHLETTKAVAQAWVDTTNHVLRGSIENKTGVEYKYIYKDKIQWKDSIVTKEVPVPVEVEKTVYKHYWYEKMLWLLASVGVVTIVLQLVKRKILKR